MSASSVLLPLLTGGGSATVITSGVGAVVVKTLKRVATQAVHDGTEDIRDDVNSLKVKFASETGGNSNGLRQKINELDTKIDGVVVDVAHLKGFAEGQGRGTS